MSADTQKALEEFVKYKGQMNEKMPAFMEGFDAMFGAALKEGALTVREKELVVLGISVAVKCENCVLVHVAKGKAAGCTDAEILEATALGIAMGGGPSAAFTPLVLKCLEEG